MAQLAPSICAVLGSTPDVPLNRDPLAVLAHGKAAASVGTAVVEPQTGDVVAPLQGTIVTKLVAEGDEVAQGSPLVVMEAMKMEHVIEAPHSGVVGTWLVGEGEAVFEGHVLVNVAAGDVSVVAVAAEAVVDLDHIRPDLAEVIERHAIGLDERRPDSVARRRKTGHRTTREKHR
ncbi:MAG: acetyl-CoA carboxylase biotin carboxyl carrier protein subunit [Acidimicrobiales bacterium]